MATKMKTCKRDGKDHPVTDFPKDAKQVDRLSTWCKSCWKAYRAEKNGGKSVPKKVIGAAKTKTAATATTKKTPPAKKATQEVHPQVARRNRAAARGKVEPAPVSE
jgi:hypothetical protein